MDTRTAHDPGVKNLANSFASSRPKGSIFKIVSLGFYDELSRPEKRSVPLKELPQLLEEFHEKRNDEIRPWLLQVSKMDRNELDNI